MHHGKRLFDGWLGCACFAACAVLPALSRADGPLAVHSVQGAAHLSPYQGQVASVGPAIVTAVRSNGFYMQDEAPDADDATSEGIFVFTDAAPTVGIGARVTVQGTVREFRPGCTPSCGATSSAFDNLTTTELTASTVSVFATDSPLPPAVVLGSQPGQRSAPLQVISDDGMSSFDPVTDGIDFYESLEGMRVQIDRAEVIDPTRTFDGATPSLEIGVLARADAGLRTARGGISIARADFNPERVFLSNALVGSFPSVNVGDRFDGAVVGVLDYSFANYKLIVTEALPAVISGQLAQEITTVAATLPQQLSIASMNVENLDAGDDPAKLGELAKIVVERLLSPDLIALEEVQDNNGATNDGVVDASMTLSTFASAIASAGGPSYAFRQIDPVNNADGASQVATSASPFCSARIAASRSSTEAARQRMQPTASSSKAADRSSRSAQAALRRKTAHGARAASHSRASLHSAATRCS